LLAHIDIAFTDIGALDSYYGSTRYAFNLWQFRVDEAGAWVLQNVLIRLSTSAFPPRVQTIPTHGCFMFPLSNVYW